MATETAPLLRHSFPRLQDGTPQSLDQYAGKVLSFSGTVTPNAPELLAATDRLPEEHTNA
ncbi:MAG TPA: hypothetical protein VGK14_01825 [Novimethylophilus sp.]|jgi:hypothetical protein|uniref:hypothetical protein n=1 Tax=Novimethylophilus sp. TaxID=2137426 RepID=UPI002F422A47